MSVLVVTAVEPERSAVLRALDPGGDVTVVTGGVGPVAAAATTAKALATSNDYTHVVSAGIGGGFPSRAYVGDVVIATASVAADLGCRTDDGFLTLVDMGLDQPCRIDFPIAPGWVRQLEGGGLAVRSGEVLTLSGMTGTDLDAKDLAARHPKAVAEAMEGWGVAWAARDFDVTVGEVRAISNIVGRRDPSTWELTAALDALARTFAALLAKPLP